MAAGPKWLPKDLQSSYHLFNELSRAATTFTWLTNRYLYENNLSVAESIVRIVKKTLNSSKFMFIPMGLSTRNLNLKISV